MKTSWIHCWKKWSLVYQSMDLIPLRIYTSSSIQNSWWLEEMEFSLSIDRFDYIDKYGVDIIDVHAWSDLYTYVQSQTLKLHDLGVGGGGGGDIWEIIILNYHFAS